MASEDEGASVVPLSLVCAGVFGVGSEVKKREGKEIEKLPLRNEKRTKLPPTHSMWASLPPDLLALVVAATPTSAAAVRATCR